MINCLTISLNTHSSSVDSVELILDVIWCSWWSLSTSCSLRIAVALGNWWSRYFYFSSWSWYQILSLITAWLKHETLVLFLFILNRGSIYWLPGILGTWLHLTTILYHTIHHLLIIIVISSCIRIWISTFSLCVLLINKSHWKLTNINWMIRILHHNCCLLLFVLSTWVLRLLNRSESSPLHFVVVSTTSIINCVRSSWRYTHWLTSCFNSSITNILLLDRLLNCLKNGCSSGWRWCIWAGSCGWEETALFTLSIFVLCCVKCLIFLGWVLSTSSACSDTSYMSSISSITVLTFYWLNYRIIQIHYKIIVNSVFIGRFRFSYWMCSLVIVVISSGLGSSVECCNSFIWWSILLIIFIDCTMLNCLIVEWVFSIFRYSLNWGSNKLIKDFSTVFNLLWM